MTGAVRCPDIPRQVVAVGAEPTATAVLSALRRRCHSPRTRV